VTTKHAEENTKEMLQDIGMGENFLDKTPKTGNNFFLLFTHVIYLEALFDSLYLHNMY
jgi:hypothetical protein